MHNLQKIASFAAWAHSAAYLFGLVMYFAVLSPIIDASPSQYLALLPQYQSTLYVWIFVAYWVAGFSLILVALALYGKLKQQAPTIMRIATILGVIWAGLIIASGNLMLHGFVELPKLYAANPAQAESTYLTLKIVQNGLVSGNELIGGLWILFLSWSALQTGQLNRGLNILGVVIGISGVLTMIVPIAEMSQIFFGFSMIVWFAWVGFVLIQSASANDSAS